jgi:hypothetical protein
LKRRAEFAVKRLLNVSQQSCWIRRVQFCSSFVSARASLAWCSTISIWATTAIRTATTIARDMAKAMVRSTKPELAV